MFALRFRISFLLTSIAALVAACSDRPPPDVGTKMQASSPYHTIGSGFDPVANNYEGDGKDFCHANVDINIHSVRETQSMATIVSGSEQLESSWKLGLGGNVDIGEIPIEIAELEIESMEQHQNDFQAAVISGFIRTVDRTAAPIPHSSENGYHSGTICRDGASLPDNAYSFFNVCGTEFVDKEEMGILVFAVADITNLTVEERTELGGEIGVEIPISDDIEIGPTLGGSMENVATGSQSKLRWHTYVVGVNSAPGLATGNGDWHESLAEDWSDWLQDIDDDVSDAYNNGEEEDSAYGTVLDFSTSPYQQIHIDNCGMTFDIEGFECVYDFLGETEGVNAEDSYLQTRADEIEWMLDNPARVNWADPDQDSIDEYEDFLEDRLQPCVDDVEEEVGQCVGRLKQAVHENLDLDTAICNDDDYCVMPDGCSEEELTVANNNLPTAEVYAPGTNYTPYIVDVKQRNPTGTNSENLLSMDDWMCFWTGMRGKFAGTGEGVRLTEHYDVGNQTDYWRARVKSQRSDSSERVTGNYHCVPRGLFHDAGTNTFYDEIFSNESVDDDDSDGILGDMSRAYALNGVSGSFGGAGEYAELPYSSSDDEIRYHVSSQQGVLNAHFLEFGLTQPGGNRVNYYSNQSGTEFNIDVNGNFDGKQLGPLIDSVCFLTGVRGNFDGGLEQVQIVPKGDWWYLEAESADGKPVEADARCLTYDQSFN